MQYYTVHCKTKKNTQYSYQFISISSAPDEANAIQRAYQEILRLKNIYPNAPSFEEWDFKIKFTGKSK